VAWVSPHVDLAPCPHADVVGLQQALGCSGPLAQILVRRGLAEPAAARRWLAADEAHDPALFAGIDAATALVLSHVAAGTRITVHGDYDVDGVCSTTILLNVLEALGADADWFLPSRREDGYGLAASTVARLAARGTQLLVTADCAITAVDEVAAARAAGMDVLITDHHAPRADGVLPDCPIVHPLLAGYPVPELCAAGVAHKFARALLSAAGRDPAAADADLDLVALATVADCVPLIGENRRLVREGLRAIAGTRKPGLRALLEVARGDPGAVDATSIGFRLAPRINAAGRMQRADAGVELLRTADPARGRAIAEELDRLNGDRRHTEQRITFAAEAQVATADAEREQAGLGPAPAYVLVGEDWHPGVIGIVASRIAERHHRPVVVVAFADEDAAEGTGSGRSIPAFDLLAGLDACAEHLGRHGGHRAAAGCTVTRDHVDAFRAAFCAYAEATLRPADLERRERADAVVSGEELGLALADELERLAPFGIGNPRPRLLVPAARLLDPRPMGEGRHLRFTVVSGGCRARAVAFQTATLPPGADTALDAVVTLERNEWNGVVEPRLVLQGTPAAPVAPVELVGEPEDWVQAVRAELTRSSAPAVAPAPASLRRQCDRRGAGVAGLLGHLVASGEPVLVACADARRRRDHLKGRLGGFPLCSWHALEHDPTLADPFTHLVALDPPAGAAQRRLLARGCQGQWTHVAWGEPELGFSEHVHHEQHALRDHVTAAYRLLRAAPGDVPAALPRSPVVAARVLAVLDELGLVVLDRARLTLTVPAFAGRTALERSPTFRACAARQAEGPAWLTPAPSRAA
jgi:single-stranded-DNA-specific exonuclease